MKKLSISMFALAALALGACTSDDVALNNGENNMLTSGDGYISLAINLPTTPSTRGANDVYDDGLVVEYAVNDATLLLFEGTSEDAAVCYETYDLTPNFTTASPDDDNITSRQQVTQKIDSPVSGNLYAMVVLNDNGMGTAIGGYIGKSLENLQTTAVTLTGGASGMTTNGFYMCNAPLINVPGGAANPTLATEPTATVTTLALIDASKIYASQSLAEANPATEIYVERGMAKVTMSTLEEGYSIQVGDQTISVTVDGFALDQTNNVTYPVRNTHTGDAWWGYASGNTNVTGPYRFAGSVLVGTTTTGTETTPTNLYRTYWALDPNYDVAPYTTGTEGAKTYSPDMTSIIGSEIEFTALADNQGNANPIYCLENTFNVAHQNQDETTRAIVKATFSGEDGEAVDFFIWDGNKSLLYDLTSILNLAETVFKENPDVEAALENYNQTEDFFSTYVTVSLAEVSEGAITTATDDATVVITISSSLQPSAFTDPETGDPMTDLPAVFTTEGLEAVNEAINDAHTIGAYAGGENYYSVLIKHFGDELTPWDIETVTASDVDPSNVNTSYPGGVWGTTKTAEENWLGRYGVLRNNWYDISIDAISGPGSATPPEAVGIPDDPTEQWISVRINILSWAVRAQSVTL